MPTLRLRAACLLAVVGSDAAFLSGGMAPRTPAMRRAAPRPLIRMQEAEAPEPEAGAAAADTTSAAEKWASRQEPAAAAPAAAPVPAPVVAAVDQAELDFEERLAMLASQVRHAPSGSGSGLGGRAGGRVGVTAETRRERAPLSVAVARAVRPALTHTLTHTASASASAPPAPTASDASTDPGVCAGREGPVQDGEHREGAGRELDLALLLRAVQAGPRRDLVARAQAGTPHAMHASTPRLHFLLLSTDSNRSSRRCTRLRSHSSSSSSSPCSSTG